LPFQSSFLKRSLLLTELHRRTDYTGFHRDIKSTDDSERFCYCWVLGVNC